MIRMQKEYIRSKRREHEIEQITGRDPQIPRERVEVEHVGQHHDGDHEHGEGVLLDLVVLRQVLRRQQDGEDGGAVQRRNRQQVEEHEVQVDESERGQEHHVEVSEQLVVGEGGVADEPRAAPRHRSGQRGVSL